MAVVAVLVAGLVLGTGSVTGPLGGDPSGESPATVEAAHDPARAPAVSGRASTSIAAWRWVTARAIGTLLGLVGLLVTAAWLALRARSSGAWRLARPERGLPTARHGSPLAARRAPPAPAGC
jgi:hypothetical protein